MFQILAIVQAAKKAAKKSKASVSSKGGNGDTLYGEEINFASKPAVAAKQKQAAAAKKRAEETKQQQKTAAVLDLQAALDQQRSSKYPARERKKTDKVLYS